MNLLKSIIAVCLLSIVMISCGETPTEQNKEDSTLAVTENVSTEAPIASQQDATEISIGNTIKEVQTANKKPFLIYGYEIDQELAGTIKDWNGGVLQGLNIQFEMTAELPGEEYVDIMGDTGISSDDQILEKAGLIVKSVSGAAVSAQ